jgi:hypothetical protein
VKAEAPLERWTQHCAMLPSGQKIFGRYTLTRSFTANVPRIWTTSILWGLPSELSNLIVNQRGNGGNGKKDSVALSSLHFIAIFTALS